jgi:hypothetical protein
MKANFFKPNWRIINEAINTENLKELRQAENELRKKIQNKVDEFYKAKRQVEQLKKITELKALPINSKIYFIARFDKIKFGSECVKISDGRTKIHFECNSKRWGGPYRDLRIEPPTEQEIKDNRLGIAISRIFNNAIKI